MRGRRHEVDVSEMENYEFEHTIASAMGNGERKRLIAVVKNGDVRYEARNGNEVIVASPRIAEASAAYNEI